MAATFIPALDPDLQLTQYALRNWQIRDGLPQNSVQALALDRRGLLWAGTKEGLVRFDGLRMQVWCA
jgi:ligand-binding sensor domain-containing protein